MLLEPEMRRLDKWLLLALWVAVLLCGLLFLQECAAPARFAAAARPASAEIPHLAMPDSRHSWPARERPCQWQSGDFGSLTPAIYLLRVDVD
jgi:hypothetical protein